MKKVLGICIGASNIKFVELSVDNTDYHINWWKVIPHECAPTKVLINELNQLKPEDYNYVAATGRQKFKNMVHLPIVTEPESTELAYQFVRDKNSSSLEKCQAIISLGSENFVLYRLDQQGHILNIHTGNKCASGTGEFFLQQIRRMNLSIEEAIRLAKNSFPHQVSGRCSVFCKSDCTHALNIGTPIGEVTAGLCKMMANKVLELLFMLEKKNIMLVGGVTQNEVMINYLKQEIENLVVPEEATFFESLGAALYAWKKKTIFNWKQKLLKQHSSSFYFLPPLKEAKPSVIFHEFNLYQKYTKSSDIGDEHIIGLDVGSTTTKAVLMSTRNNLIIASVYLRTNGDPISAARNCYRELNNQVQNQKVNIIGLGVTGSGRQIAGLHALTEGIINEIVAHATAAVYFNTDVDTIFEIGGQDAKYTYLVNGVPCDYAMNEACSAGTGSFLEESAQESLGISYKEIEQISKISTKPPNFNDQCAAFISSDIKNAAQEGIKQEDIILGLVYSICLNYINRVKGNRPVGNTIFMQGGVCYNRAVPMAMANLIKKKIIVPPEPGLMGAFGVALEIKRRIELGLLKKQKFDLNELFNREINYGKSFTCSGKSENCDRKCKINILIVNEHKIPFGGICNKYYNFRFNLHIDVQKLNLVRYRQNFLFSSFLSNNKQQKSVGITKSFLTNTYFPLYFNFFDQLGYRVVLADKVDPEGLKHLYTAHCYPAELSHGFFMNLVKKHVDYIFLPHIVEDYVPKGDSPKKEHQCTCVLLQSEPYFLRSAFRDKFQQVKVLTPVIDFSDGYESACETFISLGKQLGITNTKVISSAFNYAVNKQKDFLQKNKQVGTQVLSELEKDPSKIAVVLFGRSYNSFAEEANLGIPEKFASRGILCIPYDFLPFETEPHLISNICWASGQNLLRAAQFVKKHPQLYGCYITNFSCGPDSFLITYFRDIMSTKPSLTLELDSHSADAGINTRVEAFLDIIDRYRKIGVAEKKQETKFIPAELISRNKKMVLRASDNKEYLLTDPRVHIIFPSMGRLSTEAISSVFRGLGYYADPVPLPNYETLMKGRENTSCKECLPLILTTGSLLQYLKERKNNNEFVVYFMPTTSGNCRFSQYSVYLNRLIHKQKIENVALLTLNSENGYAGLGAIKSLKILRAAIISDIMEDIKNTLIVLSKDRAYALTVFYEQWNKILYTLANNDTKIYDVLEQIAHTLKKIQLRFPLSQAKIVYLLGEIYVRRDEFSCQNLIEQLAQRDIVVHRAPVLEWLYYVDYLVKHNLCSGNENLQAWIEFYTKLLFQRIYEKKVKQILSKSGLYHYELIDMNKIIKFGNKFVNLKLTGEAILSIGTFFKEIIDRVHGVISIGPFACLPTRVVESILTPEATIENKKSLCGNKTKYTHLESLQQLPFLSIESDGNPFPPIIDARIDSFCLQVERLHQVLCSWGRFGDGLE